jgi:hypothetical protein
MRKGAAMKPRTARRLTWLTLLAALLQVFGLMRHLDRLPDGGIGIGIGLSLVTILALALAAFGFYTQVRPGSGQ